MTIDKKFAWLAGLLLLGGLPALLAWRLPDKANADQWYAVQPGLLVQEIGLAGQIEPSRTVTLTAPFDGNVLQRLVQDGQSVDKDQELLSMDPTLIQMQVREALAQQLKARRELKVLDEWSNGTEVMRGRRAVRSARNQLTYSTQRLDENKRLYERGIIARSELDDLQRQVQIQRDELASAQSELQQVVERGTGEHRQIAEMELTNATVKYEALRKQMESGTLRAPFHGVIVPPATVQGTQSGPVATLQDGSRVNTGQPLFGLADIGQLKVVAAVSEIDVNQLRVGQAVEITGDGFEGLRLEGSVLAVNSQGMADEGSGGSAKFAVTLSILPLNVEQLRHVRLGMSARLNVVTYRNDQAVVVPPAALVRECDSVWVEYRPHSDQPVQRVAVTTGRSTVQGVEVFGLPAGHVRVGGL